MKGDEGIREAETLEELEIGAPLTVAELRLRCLDGPKVVVVGREDRNTFLTLWAHARTGESFVMFTTGPDMKPLMGLVAQVAGDKLVDETGRTITVNVYLGTDVEPVTEPSIRCPRCGMTSYNARDVEERYCGSCNAFHDDMRGDE